MSEPFIGEIKIVGFNFAPRGWAFCDGQLLAIASNTALFSLLGTTFGGDGRTTFGLPDLRGRTATHPGTGPGLSSYRWGQRGGIENVALTGAQMPVHNHTVRATKDEGTDGGPGGKYLAAGHGQETIYKSMPDGAKFNTMAADMIANAGGGQAHTNISPYLGVYHVIALTGVYPSRS